MAKEFQEPLYGCFSDILSCGIVAFIPCGCMIIQSLSVVKATGETCIIPYCLPILLGCIGSAINRGDIREKLEISGNFCTDLLVSCCCLPLAICQEYREIKFRVED